MTSRDFAYWLQGYFEVAKPETINTDQLNVIKNHLNMVFKHEIDPSHGDEKHQKELSKAHNPSTTSEAMIDALTKSGFDVAFNC